MIIAEHRLAPNKVCLHNDVQNFANYNFQILLNGDLKLFFAVDFMNRSTASNGTLIGQLRRYQF